MSEDKYSEIKDMVLAHIQALFEEMEKEIAISHQEKYTLLEDAFENASDEDELKVAFDQWYKDHTEELALEYEGDDLWDQALGGEISFDGYSADNEGLDGDDDSSVFEDDDDEDDD